MPTNKWQSAHIIKNEDSGHVDPVYELDQFRQIMDSI